MGEAWNNDNTGVLFFEKDKKSDNHPDAKGNVEPVCPHCGIKGDFWLAAWKKNMKSNGETYISLALTSKDDSFSGKKAEQVPPPIAADTKQVDDDLPF